jgi:hypothetical protein
MLDLNHRSLSFKVTLAYKTLVATEYCSNVAHLAQVMGAAKKKSRRIFAKNILKI